MSERENLSGSRGEYGECLKAKQKFNMELYNRCLKDLCKTIERQRTEWDDFQKESAKRKDSPKRNGMPNDNLAEALPQRNLQESLLFEILEIVKNLEKSFHCLCQHLSKKETFREEVKQTNGKMSSEEFWKNREEVPPILIRKIEAEESKKLHKSPEVSSPKKELSPKGTVQEEQTNVPGDNALTGQKTDSGKIQEINVPLKTAIRDDESIELQEDVIYVPEERSYKAESGKQLSIRSSKKQYDLKPVTKTESFIERLISGRSSKKISREGSVAEMKIEKMHFERKKTPNLEQSLFHMEAPSGNQEKQNQEQSKRESRQPSEFQEPSKPESRQPSEIREISKPESKQPSEIREISKPESRQPSGIQEQSKPGSKQPSGIQEQSKPGSKQTSRTSGAGTPKIQENDVQETDKQLSTSQAKSDSDKEEPSLENPHSP